MRPIRAGILLAAILFSACGTSASQSASATNTASVLKGVAFSPPSSGVQAFLQALPALGGTLDWSGDWSELGNTSGSPYQISAMAKAQNLHLVVTVTAHRNSSPSKLLRPLDSQNLAAYLTDLDLYFAKFRPDYFGIGIEVNNLYQSDPAGYQSFVTLFAQAQAKVKQLSPNTRVFVAFQLEEMKGLNGGLRGGQNDPAKNQWQLLADFPNADLLAFTSYPFLIYHDPSQVPDNYYSEITAHTERPVAISELGWPSAPVATGWVSTAALQAQFITRFATLTQPVKPRFVLWLSAFDQPIAEPFTSIGLGAADGAHKPAWDTWRSSSFS